jgi:hypothetical protein
MKKIKELFEFLKEWRYLRKLEKELMYPGVKPNMKPLTRRTNRTN